MRHVEIKFEGDVPLDRIRAAAGVSDVVVEDHRVRCVVRGNFQPLLQALAGSTVVNLTSHEPSLEEIFLRAVTAQLSYLLPPPYRLDTFAGYVQWRAYGG